MTKLASLLFAVIVIATVLATAQVPTGRRDIGQGSLILSTFTVSNTQGAIVYLRTTNATTRSVFVDIGWSGARQWLAGTGLPNDTNTAYSVTEYTNGAFTGVRQMWFKGGNVAIGSTSDDGVNKLQVTGSVTVSTDLSVIGQKAASGQRYVCIDVNGKLVSSASACSGT